MMTLVRFFFLIFDIELQNRNLLCLILFWSTTVRCDQQLQLLDKIRGGYDFDSVRFLLTQLINVKQLSL
jgi:hypothetical protein